MTAKMMTTAIIVLAVSSLAGSASAQEAQPIKIGAVYPLTGPAAIFGQPAALGHQIMIDRINAEGGLLGRKVESVVRDSKGTPADATAAARDLITLDEVDFVIGGVTSAEGLAISEVALQEKTIYVASVPKTVQMSEEKFHKYMFRTAANTNTEGGSAAIILSELGAKRVCTILLDYAYGHDLFKGFEKQLKLRAPEAEIVLKVWPKLNTTDYTAYITEVMRVDCDGVFSGIWGGLFPAFAKQASSFGFFDRVKYVSAGEIASQEVAEQMKDDMPTGVWGNSYEVWYYPDTPEHRTYAEELRKRTNKQYPPSWPIVGYMGVQILAAGIEKAGSIDTDAVIKALEGLTVQTPIGPQTIRAKDHQANRGQFWGRMTESKGLPFKRMDPVRYIAAEGIMD